MSVSRDESGSSQAAESLFAFSPGSVSFLVNTILTISYSFSHGVILPPKLSQYHTSNISGFLAIESPSPSHSWAITHFSGVLLVRGAENDRGWLDVELMSEVFKALLPSSLIEHAEDAAGLPTALQSPRAQGCKELLQTTGTSR